MLPAIWEVSAVKRENTLTATLELTGNQTFAFAPGQFNMLYLLGLGEIPISISGPAHEPQHLIHTIRAVGMVSRALTEVKPGTQLGVRGPFGSHWPLTAAEGQDLVIIAGGLGLAPVRPVIYKVLQEREKYGRVWLLYGARNPAEILYSEELHTWRSQFDLEVRLTLDRGDEHWRGAVGVVTTLIPRLALDPSCTLAMVCGPEIMMRFVAQALETEGLKQEQIYVSLERNMHCGIGLCGHCQLGPDFICKNGPVFRYDQVAKILTLREV